VRLRLCVVYPSEALSPPSWRTLEEAGLENQITGRVPADILCSSVNLRASGKCLCHEGDCLTEARQRDTEQDRTNQGERGKLFPNQGESSATEF
jgi:hypothetical protein